MLDVKYIRENPEAVKEAAKNKGNNVEVDKILETDAKKREILTRLESLRAKQNKKSKEKPIDDIIKELRVLKDEIKSLEEILKDVDKALSELLYKVPNIPKDDVPIGKNEEENKTIKEWGSIHGFDFPVKDHLELGEALNIIDTQRAAKVSGTRFSYLKGKAAILEFALVKFALDELLKENFIPIIPPVLIKKSQMREMGYMEYSGADDMYILDKDNLVLVGTSEQSIGPMHANEIINSGDMPLRYAGFSTCFRREAGSYGKDTRGILRVHQFDKVEMFSYVLPEDSDKEHDFLLSLEEKFIQALKIPYRVIKMCTGDLGLPVARKYDIEAWIPSQNTYREITSTSTTTDFQARGLNIRYKNKNQKFNYAHMLNGTAFAIGRTLVAIIENYQQKDGSIKIPKALQKYAGFKDIK